MKDPLGHGSDTRGGSTFDNLNAQRKAQGYKPMSEKRRGLHDLLDYMEGKGGMPDAMKSALASGNTSPSSAASAMHSDHVTGGEHDSTYHTINTSDPHEYQRQLQENLGRFKDKYGGPRDHAAEQRGFNSGKREINRLKKQGK